jgi:L-threonylcarbamoyladenylate synthase
MNTIVVHADSPDALGRAVAVLEAGGLVAFPTDTVYGLGALAFHSAAVQSLFVVKGRPEERAIPVLLAEAADLHRVAADVPPAALRLAAHFWPGPLTIIVPKRDSIPDAVSLRSTIAVRVPDHPVARALLRRAGPMAVTSANISGEPPAGTAEDVLEQLGGRIGLILDGGRAPGGVASTIVDCSGPEPVVVRAGPVIAAQIKAALTPNEGSRADSKGSGQSPSRREL